jgi:hypothetical protein
VTSRRRRFLAVGAVLAVGAAIAAVVVATGSRGDAQARPAGDPADFAVNVVRLIVQNRYAEAWKHLHSVDRRVAARADYVSCENQTRFTSEFVRVRTATVRDESIGLGNGRFVQSKAVDVLITLRDEGVAPFTVRHTMHVVADGGRWTWILPPWRYRDFAAGRCPTAPSAPAPTA